MQQSSNGNGDYGEHSPRTVSDALVRFRKGELTVDEYLETRIEVALDLVRGQVSAERLEMIREVVREAMANDPTTLEYVRRLTSAPPAKRPRH